MNAAISSKDIVRDLLSRLPEQMSLSEIAREIEFVAAVRDGLAQLDAGQSVSLDEIERDLPTWAAR